MPKDSRCVVDFLGKTAPVSYAARRVALASISASLDEAQDEALRSLGARSGVAIGGEPRWDSSVWALAV
jgi:hypothetical protein